jgi:L-glutamine-phosphate cytidylyltransferase
MKARAIILAAGRGSRMETLTLDRPKCLVEVRGKALLQWQFQALRAAGIDEIAVVTGYRREMVAMTGVVEFHNARWAQTNMVASLECAGQWLAEAPCIVSYSDIFYASPAVESLLRCSAPLAITYDPNWRALWERRFGDPLCDAETFRLNADGTLADIGGRPAALDDIEGQYMGLLRFEPPGWREVTRIRENLRPEERDCMHMTGTLQRVIAENRIAITAIPYFGEWGEVDSLGDLAAYEAGE